MPKIRYVPRDFTASSLAIIERANEIIAEYADQGYTLTLRQLYYQFVARDVIRNRIQEYKRLGSIINDARLAGLIDWKAIEDRTRNLASLPHWRSPASIIDVCAQQFRMDKWATQPRRVEVWIEKEALAGLVRRVVLSVRDDEAWSATIAEELEHRRLLGAVSAQWRDVARFVE